MDLRAFQSLDQLVGVQTGRRESTGERSYRDRAVRHLRHELRQLGVAGQTRHPVALQALDVVVEGLVVPFLQPRQVEAVLPLLPVGLRHCVGAAVEAGARCRVALAALAVLDHRLQVLLQVGVGVVDGLDAGLDVIGPGLLALLDTRRVVGIIASRGAFPLGEGRVVERDIALFRDLLAPMARRCPTYVGASSLRSIAHSGSQASKPFRYGIQARGRPLRETPARPDPGAVPVPPPPRG